MTEDRGDRSRQAPPITDPHEVAVVAKALVQIATPWRLSDAEAAAFLDVPLDVWDAMKVRADVAQVTGVQATRAVLVIGIRTNLHHIFSNPLDTDWPTVRNLSPLYAGRRPVDVMIAGDGQRARAYGGHSVRGAIAAVGAKTSSMKVGFT